MTLQVPVIINQDTELALNAIQGDFFTKAQPNLNIKICYFEIELKQNDNQVKTSGSVIQFFVCNPMVVLFSCCVYFVCEHLEFENIS